eukprot:CAMPEP_0117065130 /NCGR_PEP_ID=MMETSP0472-20121206/45521_1 /TAXON_ID=693140 ORGANISM="Tiarina fusus, Strain LIS" /NCGR_SAMPLE_ID=MMETSP0472 /ASSEMBLY_ACC=CAM_ASM_000603 /LENGTH=127 /DNA_ID=CAMNT_0004785613 /DNA_START=135 /DNA_END=521 /DNA_ORIENTATION=-
MTIEAALTRAFGMTFIDARALATEAKLNLGITAYPTPKQKEQLILEASRLYERQPERVRKDYQRRRNSLESVKSSSCGSEYSDNNSVAGGGGSGELSVASSTTSSSSKGFVASMLPRRVIDAVSTRN